MIRLINEFLAGSLSGLDVPASIHSSPSRPIIDDPADRGSAHFEARIRARVLDVGSGTCAAVTLAHTLLTQIDIPGWTEARIAGLAAVAVFAVCPIVNRLTRWQFVAPALFLAALLAASTFAALRNGGMTAPTTCFLILAPTMAGLMLGGRAAVAVGAISIGLLGLITMSDAIGFAQLSPHSAQDLNDLRLSALTIAVITATIMVSAFQAVLRRSIYALGEANADLAASRRTIKRNAEELDLIFNNVPVHLFFKDDQNTILRANHMAAQAAGVTIEMLRNVKTEAIYPAMAAKYFKDDLAILESGAPRIGIIEEITPASGSRGWVRTDKMPYVDPATGKRFLFVAAIDITEQRAAELALAESEQRFALAAQGSGAGIWDWIDVSRDQHFWTPRFYALLGYAPDEIEASTSTLIVFMHPEDRERAGEALRAHLADKAPFHLQVRLRHKTQGDRWYLVTGQAIWADDGAAERMIGSIIDIDGEKRAEEALIAHGRALDRSNRSLKAFSQAVSHDLRSPLRAFDHLAAWVEEDVDAGRLDAAKSHVAVMRARVRRMAELLEGLRLYAQAGGEGETVETLSCRDLVERAFEVLAPPGFRLAIASDLPAIDTASAPLAQVFRNLIDNAIKHHDRDAGVITISHEDAGPFWAFAVADDGPGVAAADQDRIFEMFEVLRRREDQAGAGAGLAIVRKVVEAAGGAVSVASDAPLERGATFRFLWPKRWPAEAGTAGGPDIGAGRCGAVNTRAA